MLSQTLSTESGNRKPQVDVKVQKGPSLDLLRSNLKFISDRISPDREVDTGSLQKSEESVPQLLTSAQKARYSREEKKGVLICQGKPVDSEMIYWKIVPGDDSFESPVTPHHSNHDDR